MSMAMVYILECADGTLYTGWTTDLGRRLRAHNTGQGARYTRGRRPVRLVYCEEHPTQREAQRREMALRRLSRAQKLELIGEKRIARGEQIESCIGDPEGGIAC